MRLTYSCSHMDAQSIMQETQGVLQNVNFPANKGQVAQTAQQQGASSEVQQLIQKLPDQQFGSIKEVVSKLPMNTIISDA